MSKVLVLGSGGHALSLGSLIRAAPDFELHAFLEREEYFENSSSPRHLLGAPVLRQSAVRPSESFHLAIGVGQIRNSGDRSRLYEWGDTLGYSMPPIVSNSAILGLSTFLSPAVQIFHRVVVGPGVRVGTGSILNSGAIIEHGVSVGDFCHVSTGVIVNGDVSIGDRVFIGSGSVIRNGVRVGNDVFIPMGSIVTGDLGTL